MSPKMITRLTGAAEQSALVRRQSSSHGNDDARSVGELPTGNPRAQLRAALARRGLSIAQLAKLTKYKAEYLDKVVNGDGQISPKLAATIAREMPELEIEGLLAGSDSQPTITSDPPIHLGGKNPMRQIYRISWAAAGTMTNASVIDETWAEKDVWTNVPGDVFAVDVKGDSMHPEINPGDKIVVRRDIDATPGKLVLVRTFDGDVWCKRYSTKDGGKFVILSSVNRGYEPLEIPADQIAWIYPVKQIIRDY